MGNRDAKGLADSCRVSQAGQGPRARGRPETEAACCPLSQGWGPLGTAPPTPNIVFLCRSNRLGLAPAWGFRGGRERPVLSFQILAPHPGLTQ